MKSAEIRSAFLKFFEQKGHKIVPSSSLVPAQDPTLLFTNAGMVQFKDLFLGKETRSYQKAVTAQKVVRAGGKHNDLENVGYTARHHTFFEMLGNFSFGGYFKSEAIGYAWAFVTEVLKLPASNLWVTVYEEDEQSYCLWRDEIGVPENRIIRLGQESNFWSMGETGPCGPCTEIFFDHGPAVEGGPPGSPQEDGDRYVEIWNLVFMQYERAADGAMTPLPQPSVDTGMGLERVAAVMQGVHSNYDIDLFKNLIRGIAQILRIKSLESQSLQVLADHIRSCSFLIADGVLPANEGRGYVLRRIIRRALRHGRRLGAGSLFFSDCVALLVREMAEAYPELRQQQSHIEKVLRLEEEKFAQTLEQGLKHLEAALEQVPAKGSLPGEVAFTLYDTYGFPLDLTADVARERDIVVNVAEFQVQMDAQRERSRESEQFSSAGYAKFEVGANTTFVGYDRLCCEAKLLLVANAQGEPVTLSAGEQGIVILSTTPFYAEAGGQVGDTGTISGEGWCFEVSDTTQNGGVSLHHGRCSQGNVSAGVVVKAEVDVERREAIRRNHSATHLLHAALREVLGKQVEQKGSLVTPERLRFDFSSFESITSEQLQRIELRVNQQILGDYPVVTTVMDQEEALQEGAMALFGEKYGEKVRVLKMGEARFSVELCGGTHVERTGQVGLVRIVAESSVASGIRRIEAVSGLGALSWSQGADRVLSDLSVRLKTPREQLPKKVSQLLLTQREQEKEIERLKAKLSTGLGGDLVAQAVSVEGVQVLSHQLPEETDHKALRAIADQMRQRLGRCVIVLAVVAHGKAQLVATVSEDLQAKIPAGKLVNHVAQQVGGKGGGKPHMAMAGGPDVERLPRALSSVALWVQQTLGGAGSS